MDALRLMIEKEIKNASDTIGFIDKSPSMYQDNARFLYEGRIQMAEEILAKLILVNSQNACEECGERLDSGTVFCSADCRMHYYSD